jgi:hypothetical protein
MSDIWNEFEKIAVEQGLISTAAEDGEREQEDPTKMPARYDSLSDDAIRLLYGVEPESIFEKNKTIIEIAHPETAIVGRTYDAMNAVIENLHERQDMMAYIALKMPNGHLTQRRYIAARQDLVNSLVRSAFLLENREESDLVTLADSCTERLVKKKTILKEAVAPLIIAGIAAAATLLGGVYYLGWGATTAQNVYTNAQKVLDVLNSLSDKPYAAGIRSDVSKLIQMAQQVYSVKDQLAQVQSVDMAINATQAESHQAKVDAINTRIGNYIEQLQKVYQAIPDWVNKIKIVHSTSTETSSDWWAKLTGLAEPFYDTDDEELIDALYGKSDWFGAGQSGGLYQAIKEDIQKMSTAMQAGQRQVDQRAPELIAQIAQPAAQPVAQRTIPVASPTTEPEYFMQEDGKVRPGTRLPTPIPAPESAPESTGAARVRPTGFGGLPIW